MKSSWKKKPLFKCLGYLAFTANCVHYTKITKINLTKMYVQWKIKGKKLCINIVISWTVYVCDFCE